MMSACQAPTADEMAGLLAFVPPVALAPCWFSCDPQMKVDSYAQAVATRLDATKTSKVNGIDAKIRWRMTQRRMVKKADFRRAGE